MSTTLRQWTLKTLAGLGVKSFKTQSGLGFPFICHVGDFASEVAYYSRNHSRTEIEFMARWCARFPKPLVFDVGGNIGFVATQLAQAATASDCRIISFEPVHPTFVKLTRSIHELGLEARIQPICCVVSDRDGGVCSIAFNNRESLFAQVRQDTANPQAGSSLTWASQVTLDSVVESVGTKPMLLKIDVEGYEAHVLRGARALLEDPHPPGICFELNPKTLGEVGSSTAEVAGELGTYRLFYLDDFEGQRLPTGHEVEDLTSLTWTCNLFAAPHWLSELEIRALFA
jgi:FkbM family methyltransferase